MKTLYLFLLLLPLALSNPAIAKQQNTKEDKAAKAEREFKETVSLIESNYFQIEINRVYPQSGRDMSRFNPQGKIIVTDSTAKGNLPFFGRAYTLPYGEGGGIEFDAVMKDRQVKMGEKKKKKSISYRFTVTGQNDTYQISIEIAPGGNCSVNLTSNNRAQISYSGHAIPIPEEKTEK